LAGLATGLLSPEPDCAPLVCALRLPSLPRPLSRLPLSRLLSFRLESLRLVLRAPGPRRRRPPRRPRRVRERLPSVLLPSLPPFWPLSPGLSFRGGLFEGCFCDPDAV